ncbi:hypothetical protein [Eubacterium sp. AB3007]|nr:hypothetical protein [Eubacterium sp. AB3007]
MIRVSTVKTQRILLVRLHFLPGGRMALCKVPGGTAATQCV